MSNSLAKGLSKELPCILSGYVCAASFREVSGSTLVVHLNYFCLLTRRTRFKRKEEEEEENKKKKKKKKKKMVDYAGPAYDGLLAMISIQFDECNDPEHNATCSGGLIYFEVITTGYVSA